MGKKLLLGDEAVALGAVHAGISAAYGYPGTPSTEILEYLLSKKVKNTMWCANEKTALEAGIGVSFAGRRALITMKHVGLNVAADPFVNGALLGIKGGLVIAVADDPGMHSSQNEQDSRFYADFALIPCLEPRSQQEAYAFTREAFDLSERLQTPVMIRLTTRLSHARGETVVGDETAEKPLEKAADREQWMLLPAFARKNYAALIEKQKAMRAWAESRNTLETENRNTRFVVVTAGLGGNYYEENLEDFAAFLGEEKLPAHIHISAYPLSETQIHAFCGTAEKILVIEEGQPFIEGKLRGLLPQTIKAAGKIVRFDLEHEPLPRTGELDPDNVRATLGLPPRARLADIAPSFKIPPRPPQLCQGCPHGDSYETIKKALDGLEPSAVMSDIGCYSLGANPPYRVPETIVCMGASVGMAKGAADAGLPYAVAVIGDSTFLHSGMTGVLDAASANTPMTLIILDNSIVAMTGCQETIVPSEKLKPLIAGLGVPKEHIIELEAKKTLLEENAAKLRTEIEYRGLSVAIFKRPCLEALRKWKKEGRI